MTRIVLAFSGRPAAAHALAWLASHHDAEVVTLTLDFGEGRELEPVRDRALTLGAARAHVLDVHDGFAREFLLPALRADALYDGDRSLVAALTRPLIAERLIEVARIEHTTVVAHACPDADRVATAVRALDPAFRVIAVPRDQTAGPSASPATPTAAEPAFVDLAFERGVPVAINGIVMPPIDLIGSLDIIARAHGIDATLGILSTAHRLLQRAVVPHAPDDLRRRYVEIIDRGDWFTPSRRTLDAAIAKQQESVSGTVRLKLFQGVCEPGRCDPRAPSTPLTVIE